MERPTDIEIPKPPVNKMNQTYQCLSCGHQFKGSPRKYDGSQCEKCNGPIIPIDDNPLPTPKGFAVNLSIKDIGLFKDLVALVQHLYARADDETKAYISTELIQIIGNSSTSPDVQNGAVASSNVAD